MKALLCRAFGPEKNMTVETVEAPALKPGHVRIEVKAGGLNFPDLLCVRGQYQFKPELPFVPGTEGAGLIAELGEGVEGFSVGDRVHTLSHMPSGHHRLPRYIRGHFGEIILYHGAHVFPDTNACFAGENPQHLYTVRFSAEELWGGDASIRDTVTADLWESYLEPE